MQTNTQKQPLKAVVFVCLFFGFSFRIEFEKRVLKKKLMSRKIIAMF